MEDVLVCPQCHVPIQASDYFCSNCGKNLKPKPSSVSISSQALLYVGSLLLPPMGFIWGIRRLREEGRTQKIVGMIAIVLTVVSLVYSIVVVVDVINNANTQLNQQMQGLQGFGKGMNLP